MSMRGKVKVELKVKMKGEWESFAMIFPSSHYSRISLGGRSRLI